MYTMYVLQILSMKPLFFDQTFTLFKIVLANFLAHMYGEVARLARRAPSHAGLIVDLRMGNRGFSSFHGLKHAHGAYACKISTINLPG